jgi:hypothetical protein
MSLFVKGSTKIYHIHIPRTGGRFITQTFVENGFEPFYYTNDLSLYGVLSMHLHWPLYEYLDEVSESTQITVVRDPISRFKSSISTLVGLRNYNDDDIKKFEDYNYFENFIDFESKTTHYANNWFRSQNEYLNKKCMIWKFEDGLGKPFRNWIYDLAGIELKDQEYSYYASELGDGNKTKKLFKLSDRIKNNVRKFYEKDYEILGY